MRKEESGSTNKQNDPHNNMCQTKRKPKKQGATTAKAPLFVSVDLAAERTPCVGDLRLIPVARESNISKYGTMWPKHFRKEASFSNQCKWQRANLEKLKLELWGNYVFLFLLLVKNLPADSGPAGAGREADLLRQAKKVLQSSKHSVVIACMTIHDICILIKLMPKRGAQPVCRWVHMDWANSI